MNARSYRALCFLEIVVVVAFLFVLTVPIQDYAMSEFKEYMRHPSPETLQVFRDKKEEEVRLREKTAIPIAFVAVALAFPILRHRRSRTNRQS